MPWRAGSVSVDQQRPLLPALEDAEAAPTNSNHLCHSSADQPPPELKLYFRAATSASPVWRKCILQGEATGDFAPEIRIGYGIAGQARHWWNWADRRRKTEAVLKLF